MKTVKNVTLNGYSRIDGQDVVNMSAQISQESTATTYNHNVIDITKYDVNREKCRGDIQTFMEKVWALEDEMADLRAGETSEEDPEVEA